MNTLTLKRVCKGEQGTFGVLILNGYPFAVTAELPWINNQPSISCIPEGRYICTVHVRSKDGSLTYTVRDVRGRVGILFHTGNLAKRDSRGCILIGEQFEDVQTPSGPVPGILGSRAGFAEFMRKMGGKSFILSIV